MMHPSGTRLAAEDPGRRGDEVAGVGLRVEADQRRAEDALEQVPARGQQAEELRRRERDVGEEPDRGAGHLAAHHLRHQHEVVVVDPDEIPGAVFADDRFREGAVDGPVRLPALDLRREAIELVVEERPQDPVGEAVVVALDVGGVELDRDGTQGVEADPQLLALRLREAPRLTRPADPGAVAMLVPRAQSGGEPTGAAVDDELVILDADRDGEAVGDEDHPPASAPRRRTRPAGTFPRLAFNTRLRTRR